MLCGTSIVNDERRGGRHVSPRRSLFNVCSTFHNESAAMRRVQIEEMSFILGPPCGARDQREVQRRPRFVRQLSSLCREENHVGAELTRCGGGILHDIRAEPGGGRCWASERFFVTPPVEGGSQILNVERSWDLPGGCVLNRIRVVLYA